MFPSAGNVALDGPEGLDTVKTDPVLRSANEILLHFAALEGKDPTFLPDWPIQQDLADGRLELVLRRNG